MNTMTATEQIIAIKKDLRIRNLPSSGFTIRYGRTFYDFLKNDPTILVYFGVSNPTLPRKFSFLGVTMISDFRLKEYKVVHTH